MAVTEQDLRQIVTHLQSMGDTVPAHELDSVSRVVLTLLLPQIPETVDTQILVASQASAVIGYLENKWRGISLRQKIVASSKKAQQAKMFREAQRLAKEKVTEAQVTEHLAADPESVREDHSFAIFTEIADIMETLRYAIKNRFDGLLELSRNERQTSRTG